MLLEGKTPGFSFFVVGGAGEDTLIVTGDRAAPLVVRMPVALLPWRDLKLVEKLGRRPRAGCDELPDPLARARAELRTPAAVTMRTGLVGAAALTLAGGVATIAVAAEARLQATCLRLGEGTRVPIAVTLGKLDGARQKETVVDVLQLSAGVRVGGVRFVLRPRRG